MRDKRLRFLAYIFTLGYNAAMRMGLPVFLLFSIYGVINTYLPLFLRNMGYSISTVGILLALFEIAGLAVPFAVSPLVDRRGNYGSVAVFYGILMILLPLPLMYVGGFWYTALFLSVYAVGFKGAVPLTDSHISYLLGARSGYYGRVRAAGSLGFVAMTLLLQFGVRLDPNAKAEVVLWLTVPAALFTIAMLAVPGLQQRCGNTTPPNVKEDETAACLPRAEKAPSAGLRNPLGRLAEFPKIFWTGMALVFVSFFGLVPATKFLPFYVVDRLHIQHFAVLWAISASSEIPFMFFAYRFLRRFNTLHVLVFCTAAVAVRSVVYILFPTFTGAVAGQLFNTITYGVFHPAAILFVSQHAPKRQMVLGMTLYSLVTVGVATVFGNFIGGFIIERLGYTALFLLFAAVPLAAVIVFFCNKRKFI